MLGHISECLKIMRDIDNRQFVLSGSVQFSKFMKIRSNVLSQKWPVMIKYDVSLNFFKIN